MSEKIQLTPTQLGALAAALLTLNVGYVHFLGRPDPFTGTQGRALIQRVENLEERVSEHQKRQRADMDERRDRVYEAMDIFESHLRRIEGKIDQLILEEHKFHAEHRKTTALVTPESEKF